MLELKLLGIPVLRWQGEVIASPPQKVLAMLSYLALHQGLTRQELAALFWGNGKIENVRVALYTLRDLPGVKTWLFTKDNLVFIQAKTDVNQLETALKQQDFSRALSAWRGDNENEKTFLKGIEVKGAENFNDWLELERARLNLLYLDALQGRVSELEAAQDYQEGLRLVHILLQRDPLNESAHRMAMRLKHLSGNREGALAQFETCRQVLLKEFDLEPSAETLALLKDIEQGGISRGKSAVLIHEKDEVPDLPQVLIGRDELITELMERLGNKQRVLLHGLGGAGKTALAASAVIRHLAEEQAKVLWLQVGDDDTDSLFDALASPFDEQKMISQTSGAAKGRAICELLKEKGITLLVLDDVWNSYALSKVLETLPEDLPLLVTSRQRHAKLGRLNIGRLTRAAATELLSHYAGQDLRADEAANRLCETLGDHTFALRIAGLTLAVDEQTPKQLLGAITDNPHTLKLPTNFAEEGRDSFSSLLNISLAALSDEAYEAFLAMGALFVPSCTSELLALCIRRSEDEVEKALMDLQGRGLAERVAEPGSDIITYRLHDLVFSFVRENKTIRPQTAMKTCRVFLAKHQHDFEVLEAELGNLLGTAQAAKEQGDKGLLVEMMRLLVVGDAYYAARGHNPRSLELLKDAISSAKEIEEFETAHYLVARLGDNYREMMGDLERALDMYQEALKLVQTVGDRHREAILLSLIGGTHFQQHKDDSDEILRHAYKLAKTHNDDLALSHILQIMSYISGEKEEYEKAHQLCTESIEVTKRLRIKGLIGQADANYNLFFTLFNLGVAEHKLKCYRKALHNYNLALSIAQEENNQLWKAYALHEIGEMYHEMNQRCLAQENYDRALALYYQNNARSDTETLVSFMQSEDYIIEEGFLTT